MSKGFRFRTAKAVFATAFAATLVSHTVGAQIVFDSGGVPGTGLSNPTSLDFGPDDRLYVSQQNGVIKAYTLQRNAAADYTILDTETITEIQGSIQNHNDDGTESSQFNRQITGIMSAGTAANPVLYVSSSDPRIAVGTDTGLDTNSGVISRLTCVGGISGNQCTAWDRVDIVRGLPRSEENHATNGLDLDESTNILYVMSGGHANKGAPGNNFSGTPEYFLSAAMLAVDLDAIATIEANNGGPFVDPRNGAQFVYDLVTLDDPSGDRADLTNADADFPYGPTHPYYNLTIDAGDPFGGNNGLNQAIPVPGGPVQIHSPGYRNAYDVVVTEGGRIYTWDNGPNTGWGGQPLIYSASDVLKGTGPFDQGAGDYCTNEFNETASDGHGDSLHDATTPGYYGGHPTPIRAFPDRAGVIEYEEQGNGNWVNVGDFDFFTLLPTGFGVAAGDFPNNPVECNYLANDPVKNLETVSSSTNGLAEYTATNFAGAMQGDLLAASFNGNIYRCKPDGPSSLADLPGSGSGTSNNLCEVLFSGFGSQPLDVIALGDSGVYPGTVWAATYGANSLTVFEPNDFLVCDPSDPAGDSDSDGFTNGDEDDNGTDPCSGGSQPDDNDGDLISDLNDPDDDNDGILDVDDPFAIDADDGLSTGLPIAYSLFNNDPGTGLFGLGFTGLMLDVGGSETWLDLFDPTQLAAGGAAGLLTVEAVTTGDAFQTSNSQDNAFLFGVDVDSNTPPFIVHSRVLQPFFAIGGSPSTPEPFQSFGIFLGTGDQDNYLKLVIYHANGAGGIQVGTEVLGSFSSDEYGPAAWTGDLLTSPSVDLLFAVDPQAGTVQPQVSLDEGTTVFDLGAPIAIPAAWLSNADSQGLALGVISTANGPGGGAPSFGATWDFIDVDFATVTSTGDWQLVDDEFAETRHEGGFVQAGEQFHVLGGRESEAVRSYDPVLDIWTTGATSPIKLHHFQAVEHDGLIYAIGAMTGFCCAEPEAPNVYIYDPLADIWITGPEIPVSRLRGGGGAALYNGQIYWVSGNTNGHTGPVSAAVDRFDPATGTFTPLADIPNPRDHFFVTVANDKLYAIGGRTSGTPDIFSGTVAEVDVFDLQAETWSTLPSGSNLPTPRAAAPTGLIGNEIIVAGGESGTRTDAHPETQALDLADNSWRSLTDMLTPRHATQAIVSNNGFYVAAGSPVRGGPGSAQLDLEALYLFGPTTPTGTAITAGVLDAPAAIDFGAVQTGSGSDLGVLLSNTGGNQGIVIEDITVGGAPFSLATPFGEPVVIPPGGTLNVTVSFEPTATGVAADTLTVTHSGGTTLNIDLDGNGVDVPVPLFRVNAGGGEVAATDGGPAWSADTAGTNSIYLADAGSNNTSGFPPLTSRDGSVPAYVPDAVFDTERWDNAGGTEMSWAFPVSPGTTYLVRLYLMNGFGGTSAPDTRVFDITIEGAAPPTFNDVDLSEDFGHKVAGALEFQYTAADDTLNIDFLHDVIENPLVNALEVLTVGPGGPPNVAPEITPVPDQTNDEGDDIDLTITATDLDGPSNLIIGAAGLPPGLSVVDPTNGLVGGVISNGAAFGSPYTVTVTAFDGLDTTESQFTWTVNSTGGGATAVLHRINVGGPQLAAADASSPDWSADTSGSPSTFITAGGSGFYNGGIASAHPGPIITTDPSIPPSAPAEMFNTERFDPPAAPEMTWAIPVPDGALIEVRLFFAELFGGITAANQRVFDVSVEGVVPAAFTALDAFDTAGPKGGFMASTILTMGDDTLDLVFLSNLQSPALKGIEVIQLDPASNTAPDVTNPGNQASVEGDIIDLQIVASDVDLDTLNYGATGLPPGLSIDPSTGLISGTIDAGGSGAFLEEGGLLVIEMESAETIPANWAGETGFTPFTGSNYLRYNGSNQFNNPGVDTITYPIEIQTPGTYRFEWRSLIASGTLTTEKNDSWLRINADAFYGEQPGGSIVCPKGFNALENDCTGGEPDGSGSDGWFKIYRSGGDIGTWSWITFTSDNDAHAIFARFDAPGVYSIEVSGRSLDHAIDRMVLATTGFLGDPRNEALPESGRSGAGAAAGSPYATEITVSDSIDPTVINFDWVVTEPVLSGGPSAVVSITPSGGLNASTFSFGSIVIENTSGGGEQIDTVVIDLSTGLLPDIVFDPVGTAGDATGKGLTPDSGAFVTGFVVPGDPDVDPFSQPHNGIDNGEGFDVITLNFTDFDPGEVFSFSVDIDPTSIKDATGTGDAGAVSGLELSGTTVQVTFDDASDFTGETFRIPASDGGATTVVDGNALTAPVLSVPGATLVPTTLSPDHTAAVIPAGSAAQSILVSGPIGATVRLLQIEAALLADLGNELELFEANEALVINEFSAVIEPDGDVEIPVTLTRSDATDGGFNHFTAVIEDGGVTGPNANFIVLELDSGVPNVAPVAVDDQDAVAALGAVAIDLLGNDSDSDGTLNVSSITIVDPPLNGTLTPGVLGSYIYTHVGPTEGLDSFTYTVNDNDGATSNVATVEVIVGTLTDLPDDVDGDGTVNAADNDDDNDGLLDTYDPFAIDADNGLTGDLPISLPLFTTDPGTGLFGLGFTGLMTNGDRGDGIDPPVEGDDYQSLYDAGLILVDDNPGNGGVYTLLDVSGGDAFANVNNQENAFQVGLNVDDGSEPFVVHGRVLAPYFDGVTPVQNFLSAGIFIGNGDQDNYLKMVIDGNADAVELLLEVDQTTSGGANVGSGLLASTGVDLFLLVDPSTLSVQPQLSVDGGALTSVGAPISIPAEWLASDDDFGLAMGLIQTSNGPGPVFDANYDLLEAYFLATDDLFAGLEDAATSALDVLANDHVDPDLTIIAVGTPDSGGSAVLNDGGTPLDPSDDVVDYTPAANFTGIETFTYTVQDSTGLEGIAIVTVDLTAVNDAPSVTLGADQQVLEDAGAQLVAAFATGFAPGGGTDEAGQVIADFVLSNDNNGLFSSQPDIANDGSLSYTPADDANGVATVSVQVQDDGGTANGGVDLSAVQTFTITVGAVNDAPSVSIGSDQQVGEDAGAQLVAAFATGFAPGGGADEAGQVVADFVLSNDNNALFAGQPDIANDGSLSYTPAADATGSAEVSVQVRDSGGTANGGVDLSAVLTFTITVNDANDPPTITLGGSQTVDEDAGAQLVAAFATDFDPGPGEGGQALQDFIVGNDNNGLFAVQPDIANDGTLSYTPADDANGVATVSVQVQDDGGGTDTSAVQQFTITVNAVNDAPSITLGGNPSVDEDAGAQAVPGFASGFAPGGGADEAGQAVTGFVVSNDNNALFASQPVILVGGELQYTPAADQTGSATVSVQVQDDGGTDNGGVDLSAVQQFTITVVDVNDPPSITLGGDQTVDEDAGAQVVAAFATGFDPGVGEGGQSLLDFGVGNDNPSLFAVAPDIANDGTLSFTPADDAVGSATVTVTVQDDGGTAMGGDDTSAPQQFTITVDGVNDAPTVTLAGNQQVLEDGGAQVVAAFASAFAPGGGTDEAGQAVAEYVVSNDNNALFASQPVITAGGELQYTPAADQTGSATVSVQVRDDGGTANGGADTSVLQQFTIEVADVNDAPGVTLAGNQQVLEDAGAQAVAAFASAFDPGPGEGGQAIVDYLVSNDNNALFAGQPDIANDGTLSYIPADDANGVATVSVQVQDDGGVENGGVDTSAVQQFTITVGAVNDAPTVLIGGNQAVDEDAGAQLVSGFATGFQPGGGADEAGQVIAEFIVGNDNPGLFDVAPAIDTNGDLSYTPANDQTGSATVSVQVRDDGGTDDGGVDTSAVQTFTISVGAVNDAPSVTLAGDQVVNEDDGAQAVPGFASGFDAGAGDTGQVIDDYLVSNDNNVLFAVQPDIANDGTLSYTPVADANGVATVSVQVRDDGGTEGGGVDTSAVQTFTITVNAVNDAPDFTLGPDQTVELNAGVQLVPGFAGGFEPGGGPDEAGQVVNRYLVGNDNASLFAIEPDISIDGRLSYEPAEDEFGTATVSVRVRDDGGTANGGVDTSAVKTFTITVNPEMDAPIVTRVDTVAGTADGVLVSGESTRTSVTQLLVSFSEDVSAGAGASVGGYRLFAAGANGVIDSAACTAAGDDVALAIDAVTWLAGSATAAVAVNGGIDLPRGRYLLAVCEGIEDAVGNALDGDVDGSAGGDFTLPFRITRTNGFVDPNFDEEEGGWMMDEFGWSPVDADDHETSGSMAWARASSASGVGMVSQCVNLDQPGAYSVAGLTRIVSPDGTAELEVMVDAHTGSDCNGDVLLSELLSAQIGATANGWEAFEVDGLTPMKAVSVRVTFIASADAADAATVELDNVFIESSAVMFIDDFED